MFWVAKYGNHRRVNDVIQNRYTTYIYICVQVHKTGITGICISNLMALIQHTHFVGKLQHRCTNLTGVVNGNESRDPYLRNLYAGGKAL